MIAHGFTVALRVTPVNWMDKGQTRYVRLNISMLAYATALAGGKASGEFLVRQARLAATNVEGVVIPGSGHWLVDEAPGEVIPKRVEFLGR